MIGPISRLVAAFVLCGASAAHAQSLPPRKPGLWESKANTEMGSIVTKQCIDEKTDQLAHATVGGPDGPGKSCSKQTVTKTAAGYETESVCKFGAVNTEGKGIITGDFNSAIRMEIVTKMEGLPGMPKPITRTTVIENRWIGPCEAGQQPGDIIMSNGKVVKTPGTPK